MVGVPGRSKACLTCLRRRKACDLLRPTCKECQRLGLDCTWYKHQAIFVDATTQTTLRAKKMYLLSSSRTQAQHVTRQIPRIQPAVSLQRLACQDDYINLFLTNYLPRGARISSTIPDSSTTSWIVAACTAAGINRNGKHHTLRLAIVACSLCMLGFQQGDDRLLGEGRRLYGLALLQLGKELQTVSNTERLTLVRTARMLGLFEIFFGRHSQRGIAHGWAWSIHKHGEQSLLLDGNADMYKSGEAHQIFVDGRLHLATESILTRKASVLDQSQWKTIPWLGCPRTPKDLLLDLFVEIPRLLETFDHLRSTGQCHGMSDPMQHFIQQCFHLSQKLGSWYRATGASIECKIMTATAEQAKTISVERLANAQLLSLYWCCLLLTIELRQAVPEFQKAWALAEIPTIEGAQTICRKIIKVVAVFLNAETGWYGTNLAACPLLIIQNFRQKERNASLMEGENCMLQELLDTMKGNILAVFIRSATWKHVAALSKYRDHFSKMNGCYSV